ncbi:hypothetical protein [Deinococcus roseus]|uniref:Uncharacterized protein n=1 Tax=Deinococcus roseus TaxID=392414 RepID=A0ABQ2DEJ6_9DEIO|nr:hypothetical protein [Deinococcus roseus]GGJ55399.1 hypothetical protein GCM10008938_46970 [Deinococcus roseus]
MNSEFIQRVAGVPLEATHLVMAESDLVWPFGPRMSHWNKPHLVIAAQHFQLSLTPDATQTASQYEQGLLFSVLDHLQQHPSHRFVVLNRVGTHSEGWVCLVPSRGFAQVQRILSLYRLNITPAGLREVLQ